MALDCRISTFFESDSNLSLAQFPADIKEALLTLLKDTSLFKAQRMKALIHQPSFTKLEWLEWFNWYFVMTMQPNLPDWLNQAVASVARSKNVTCMSYPELLDQGWQIRDIVISSVFLSDSGIANYHANNEEIDHWCRLRSKNLHLFSGAISAGELVGQVGLIKLDEQEYQQLRSGQLEEKDIQGVSDEFNGPLYLYIPSVVLKPEWRKGTLIYKLFTHLVQQLTQQEGFAPRIKGLIALAYTDDGAALCSRFNFTLEHVTASGDRVFTGSLDQLLTALPR